jgi:hypothetical protein
MAEAANRALPVFDTVHEWSGYEEELSYQRSHERGEDLRGSNS